MNAVWREEVRVFSHVVRYELRKATAFPLGFVLREVLRGVGRPLVMMFVFTAILHSTGAQALAGYTFKDLVAYLIWTAVIYKCMTNERSLDIAEQIFDGQISKYLVLPVNQFTLVWAKFVQFTILQLSFAALFWLLGALLVPTYWPYPPSLTAFLQALVLLLLGACCYLLIHLILNYLAFRVDVVWSLLAMFGFISNFVSGALVPVPLMPDALQAVLRWTFPFWTIFGPTQLLLGRASTTDFLHGVGVLSVWLCLLNALALRTWRRGVLRYAGVGA